MNIEIPLIFKIVCYNSNEETTDKILRDIERKQFMYKTKHLPLGLEERKWVIETFDESQKKIIEDFIGDLSVGRFIDVV